MGKNNGKRKARTDFSIRKSALKKVENSLKKKELEDKERKRGK